MGEQRSFFNFTMIFNIITSYPRSGNTWIRFILYDLLYNSENKIIDNSNIIEKFIPDTHKFPIVNNQFKLNLVNDLMMKKEIYLKTHFPYNNIKEFPINKILLIVRNPLDVLVSLINYYEVKSEEKSDFIDYFIKKHTTKSFEKLHYGSWDNHLKSWLKSDKKKLIITYENLLKNFNFELLI